MISPPMTTARTDFNSINSKGQVRVSRRRIAFSAHKLVPGAWLYLEDADGNRCLGVIEEAEELILRVRPTWETWETWQPSALPELEYPIATASHPFRAEPETGLSGVDHSSLPGGPRSMAPTSGARVATPI